MTPLREATLSQFSASVNFASELWNNEMVKDI